MPEMTQAEPDLLQQAFALLAERGWGGFSFTELARRAGVPLAAVYAEFPDRGAILRTLGRRLDEQMLAVTGAELDGLSPRERVFEMVMRRLDAMAPYKEGLRALQRGAPGDPQLLLGSLCNIQRLSSWLADAAESASPLARTPLAGAVLSAIYVRVCGVWLDDDTPDLARTLAELDRRLQQVEGVARFAERFRRPRGQTAGGDDAAAASAAA